MYPFGKGEDGKGKEVVCRTADHFEGCVMQKREEEEESKDKVRASFDSDYSSLSC